MHHFVEDLCKKCRKMPWKSFPCSGSGNGSIDHHKSLSKLLISAKTGCRACQIFWLYIQTEAKVDDDFELKFIWEEENDDTCLIIKGSSQSFTCGKHEEDISIPECSRYAMGNQTMGEFGGQVSIPSQNCTTDESLTINNTFVVYIYVHIERRPKEPWFTCREDLDLERVMQGIVKPWVENCVKNHPKCREVQQLDFGNRAPTRLIDVGTPNDEAVKLVDTGGLSDPRYLILSYCWGTSNDKSKTTQANLEQRRVSIRINALPKAIRDAIAVTRLMGVQYLWVDAICIIQQDKENNDCFLDDWNIEAAKMASYYSNALCCISNLSAADSSEGFLQDINMKAERRKCDQDKNSYDPYEPYHETEIFRSSDSKYKIAGDYAYSIYLPKPIRCWNTEWERSPLMRRAWALQEWILSRRILHCTKNGMFMECGRGVCQPNDPFTKPVAAWHHTHVKEISNILRESTGAQVGDLWIKLVEFYSTMNLTNPEDRLVAIDGIARFIRAKYNIGHFAGVLSSHIAQTLLWRRRELEGEENLAVSFPSWSWSSTMNVTFSLFMKGKSYVRCIDDDCFLLSDKVVNYDDPSTRLLSLRGPVLPVSVMSHSLHIFGNCGHLLICSGPFGVREAIKVYMDSTKELTKLEQRITNREHPNILLELLVCLKSITSREPITLEYYGLVVEKLKDAGANAYQRIGFFSFDIEKHRKAERNFDLRKWKTDINLL